MLKKIEKKADAVVKIDIAVGQHRDLAGAAAAAFLDPIQIGWPTIQPQDRQAAVWTVQDGVVIDQQNNPGEQTAVEVAVKAVAQFIRPVAVLGGVIGQKQVDGLGRRRREARRIFLVQALLLGRNPGRPGVQRQRLRIGGRRLREPTRLSKAIAFPFMRKVKIQVHFSSAML